MGDVWLTLADPHLMFLDKNNTTQSLAFLTDVTAGNSSLLGANNKFTGSNTFSQTITSSITGNAATVTNGVYATGSYADPSWITSLGGAKIVGAVASAVMATTAGIATTAGALAATPTQCGSNMFSTGIAANGNSNCAQPASTNLSDSSGLVRQTQILFSSGGNNVGNTSKFVGTAGTSSSEVNIQQVVAVGGTIIGMQCFSAAAPVGSSATFTMRKNGASTAAVCTIAAGSTKGSATGLSVSYAAGDVLDIQVGGPLNKPVSVAVAATP